MHAWMAALALSVNVLITAEPPCQSGPESSWTTRLGWASRCLGAISRPRLQCPGMSTLDPPSDQQGHGSEHP